MSDSVLKEGLAHGRTGIDQPKIEWRTNDRRFGSAIALALLNARPNVTSRGAAPGLDDTLRLQRYGTGAAPDIPVSRIRHYELIRELGHGGMGRVFLARDLKLGRRVAVKLLNRGSPDSTQRLLAEARATARCNHENIVVIHEADEHEGQPYIVLEYLDGSTLRQVIGGQRLSPHRAIELMLPVVRALTCAHAFLVIHRDLKPDNIFVTSSGAIKVLDFGLATQFQEARAAADERAIVGTLPYMSPEQFAAVGVDSRTDLWAVGIMLYEMVVGRHPLYPFTIASLTDNARRIDQPMPRVGHEVAELPASLERIIDRCLAKRKEDRHGSARELLAELELLVPRRYGRRLAEDQSPYPGLAAFQESDADRFFGRADQVAHLVQLLRTRPLVGVAGPSGVGKSSFVRAGVVPALKAAGESWEGFILRPGRSPLASLASLLQPLASNHGALAERLRDEPGYLGAMLRVRAAQKREKILIFVDQLEELFTLSPDKTEQTAFIDCLSGVADDAVAPLRIVVSIRSDFLERAAENRAFMDDLMRGLMFLAPLDKHGLRAALLQPLELQDYRFEAPEMVADVLEALAPAEEAIAGALPLLQFAAARLWDKRDRRRRLLTRASYIEMGGVAGALAAHADEVLAALAPGPKRLLRVVLLSLVTPDRTRALVDMKDLEGLVTDSRELHALVDQLVTARLLVLHTHNEAERTSVELVHESLIDEWPTLRRWLEESKEDAAFLGQLRAAAKQWDAKGRLPGLLWSGEAADEARLWYARYRGDLGVREKGFLQAVFALAGRATRIRTAVTAAIIVLLAVAVLVGSFAFVSVRRAEQHAVAEANRTQHEAERAREAERRVKDQLAVVRAAEEAKEKARSDLEKNKEDLRDANARLRGALVTAEEESRRAQEEKAHANALAQSVRETNTALEKLLAEERARAERLEKERKKIMTTLK
jgi:hypothetical protein